MVQSFPLWSKLGKKMASIVSNSLAINRAAQALELNRLVSYWLCGKVHLPLYQPSPVFKDVIQKIDQLASVLYTSEPAQTESFYLLWKDIRKILTTEILDYSSAIRAVLIKNRISAEVEPEMNLGFLEPLVMRKLFQIFSLYEKSIEDLDVGINVETYLQNPMSIDKPEKASEEIAEEIDDKKALSLALLYAEKHQYYCSIEAIYYLSQPKLIVDALRYFHKKYSDKTIQYLLHFPFIGERTKEAIPYIRYFYTHNQMDKVFKALYALWPHHSWSLFVLKGGAPPEEINDKDRDLLLDLRALSLGD